MLERPVTTEQHLVKPDRDGVADAVRVVDQPAAVVVHGVHHRVPVTAKIGGDFRHGSAVMADLERCPPPGAFGDAGTLGSDAVIGLDERHHLTVRARATPPRLRPHQPGSPTEARQINQLDVNVVVTPHRPTAARTRWSPRACGDRVFATNAASRQRLRC